MPSGFCLAASCLDWDRRKRLCTGAGEGARVRDRRVQAPPSGNSLPSLAKTAPGWADCALTHGWGLAIAPRKDSWKDRSLFRSDVPPGQTRWHGPCTQHPGDAQHPVLFLHPTWWAAPSPYWASGLEVKGTIWSKLYWALHVPQRTRNYSLLPKHFRAEWRFISKHELSLQCLISVSFLPEAATQRKWPSKGMIFCFTQSLLSWGCFFCFLSSILFLPSPLQNKKDHTSHQDLSSQEILFFSSFDNFLFIRRKSIFLFFQYNCILLWVLWYSNNCHEVDMLLAVLWKRHLIWSTNHLVSWLFPSVTSFLFLVGGG